MKKLFVSICGFILVLMLVGCSKVEATNEQEIDSNGQVEESDSDDLFTSLMTEALASVISDKVYETLDIDKLSFFEICQLQYKSGKLASEVVEISDKMVSISEKHHLIVDNEEFGNIDLPGNLQSRYSEYVTQQGTWAVNPSTKEDSTSTLEYWEKGELKKSFKLKDFSNKGKESNLYQIVKVEHNEMVIGQGTVIMVFDGKNYETIARDAVEVLVKDTGIIYRTVNGYVYTFYLGKGNQKKVEKIDENAIALSKYESNHVIKEETKEKMKSFNIIR